MPEEEISTGILFLIERKIYKAEQKEEKVQRHVSVKEKKKADRLEAVIIHPLDKNILCRFVWNCPHLGDKEEYLRLCGIGLMRWFCLLAVKQEFIGVTPRGQQAIKD